MQARIIFLQRKPDLEAVYIMIFHPEEKHLKKEVISEVEKTRFLQRKYKWGRQKVCIKNYLFEFLRERVFVKK